ncbi:hypothetical protein T459_29445 [Capsicum annuum]|uniref:Knottins-like domain-containing protein n=1 Tax=Capsicum annuum TaxID=4072 RepID=A0A2G2Y5L2_CAPAN|nr:hypothetical protein T459_29445 [Capsicum annuum]
MTNVEATSSGCQKYSHTFRGPCFGRENECETKCVTLERALRGECHFDFRGRAPDFQFHHPVLQKGFGMFVEFDDDSEELVPTIVGKKEVEHMVMHSILDMEVGKWSIMDFHRDYRELGYELGLETDDNDNDAFLDVPVLQLQ